MAMSPSERKKIIDEYSQHATDTGSTEVQIALLTGNIVELIEHCKENHKDYSSKRGLFKKVCQRKSLLKYLARKNKEAYTKIIKKLGLRK